MYKGSNSGSYKTAMFADCLANSKEIFQLIDRVFPIDSCRHYEVLPLKLNGSDLVLGMLDPQNRESLNFINSIAKVFKYNLEIQLIDLQTYQIILANYPQNSNSAVRPQDENKTIIDTSFNPSVPLKKTDNRRRQIDSAPTIISHSSANSHYEADLDSKPSDLPPDLDFLKDLELTSEADKPKPKRAKFDNNATLFEIPAEFKNQKSSNILDDKATIITGNPAELLAQETAQDDSAGMLEEAQISQLLAEIGTQETLKFQTTNFLPQLSPHLSWQKLLEQAFEHHTDYLKLTRHDDLCSVNAERNQTTQSVIDNVALPIFCSLIDEIKRMARLPQNTTNHPKKVVLERFHEQERILLRLEFSARESSEEVAIQILRDRALETYEQQQMDRVSEQALQLAKQLEKTLRRIQACFNSAELTNLAELQTIHSRINHQLRLLGRQR